jgi:tetratricopeptide (TPR) repeat protein
VPVWHEGTAQWVRDGKLVLLGVIQEQHADRCRLFAQWKGFGWPILQDAINVVEATGVPIQVAIDEHGIVRSTRPALDTFRADFLERTFANDAKNASTDRITPIRRDDSSGPDWTTLKTRAKETDTAIVWRQFGDTLALWGGAGRVEEAMDAYTRTAKLDPKDGAALFRLGVCYRRRFETQQHRPGDFQAAIDSWGKALDLDPNQYIWRRRIQQYGPRLDKPYAFYDWVETAEQAIRARGEKPVALAVRPRGAEIAQPLKALLKPQDARNPDPDGEIHRDKDGLVRAEVSVAPARVRPGEAARVHVLFRLDPKKQAHWNNESEPLRLWVDSPKDWHVSDRLLQTPAARQAVSGEERALDFEVKTPKAARDKTRLSAYALYYVCEDKDRRCLFLRLDIPIEIPTLPEGGSRKTQADQYR